MKDRTTTVIAVIVGVLAFFQFVFFPTINRRSAAKTMNSILRYWTRAEMIPPMTYWLDRNKYPNVYKLDSYKIRNRQLFKKNDRVYAKYEIDLHFSANPTLPLNSLWAFTLTKTRKGWKVIDFRLSRLHHTDIKRQEALYNPVADRKMLQQIEEESKRKMEEKAAANNPPEPIPPPAPPETPGQRRGYRTIPAMID